MGLEYNILPMHSATTHRKIYSTHNTHLCVQQTKPTKPLQRPKPKEVKGFIENKGHVQWNVNKSIISYHNSGKMIKLRL